MRKRIEWEWEKLDEGTFRAKVIGGWILHRSRVLEAKNSLSGSESMIFIADRDHEWHILPKVVQTQKEETKSLAKDFESK